jgi:hypothetical protein
MTASGALGDEAHLVGCSGNPLRTRLQTIRA